MKICFITHNLNTTDGGGRFSHDLVENLKKESIEVTVITTENSKLSLNFFKIRKIFKNSDIIHAIDIWPNGFYARIISLGLKKPIVITALGTYSVAPFYSWRKFLMKRACRRVQLVAISKYTKEKILEIMPDIDIKVICPGFNLDFWSGNSFVSEEISRLKPYILSVGALKPRKGLRNSLEAFDIVSQKVKNINYVIVGQGEQSDYAEGLKKFVNDRNLAGKVTFITSGISDNLLLCLYQNASLFVLTSVEEDYHFEGFGIVYLEAAASGLPIIASLNSGAASAVKNGYNGVLLNQNDCSQIASAISKIVSNESIRKKFSDNSREWAKNFAWDKIIKEYIAIYEEIA